MTRMKKQIAKINLFVPAVFIMLVGIGITVAVQQFRSIQNSEAKTAKLALLDLTENGELSSVSCAPDLNFIKLTGTGTPGRAINVYLDNPRSESSPYLIQCGKKTDYHDKDYKTIGQDTVGADGKFECYLDTTDYNGTVLAGHKLFVYTYDPTTWYAYKLTGSLQGTPAPNCAVWSTNFICNKANSKNEYDTLQHNLTIKCAGKEIYNKSNRVGDMGEAILLPEGENCEATCHSLDSNFQMYGYNIGNSLGVVPDDQLTKTNNETISFKMDKSKGVYRWVFKNPNDKPIDECIKENNTPASGQSCCTGLIVVGGVCKSATSSQENFKDTDPLKFTMQVGDKTYKISAPTFDFTPSGSIQQTKLEITTDQTSAKLSWSADSSVFKYCERDGQEMNNWAIGQVDMTGNNYQVTIPPDYALFQITCSSNQKSNFYTQPGKMARVMFFVRKGSGQTTTCIAENQTKNSTQTCCAGLVEKDGKCAKTTTTNNDDKDTTTTDKNNEDNDTTTDKNTTDNKDDTIQGEWKDYSSMKEMPKVTVDLGTLKCSQVPEEKFHGCYYTGKIDDQTDIPNTSLELSGETVLGNRIDHDWGTEQITVGPDGTKYSDNVSAVWRGKFYFGEGDYLFKATADDGIKVIVDDKNNVLYKWYPQPRNTHISDLTHLSAGWHTVTVRYFEEGHKAAVKVWWEHQKPAVEVEKLTEQLGVFQQLIEQLRNLVQKILDFFGIE